MKWNSFVKSTARFCLAVVSLMFFTETKAQVQTGQVAPDFVATDMNGNVHHLYDYLNQGKYVLLKFGWFGCGSCDLARTSINNVYHNFGCNQKDLVILELDPINTNAYALNSTNYINDLIAAGNPFDNTSAVTDSNYIKPRAPYITADGGADTITAMYGIPQFTTEYLIEPTNKKVYGTSLDFWLDSNNVMYDTTPFSLACTSLVSEGLGIITGFGMTQFFEEQLPDVFHYVPSAFFQQHITSNPNFMPPIVTLPFEAYCGASFSGCDTMKPLFTNYTVSVWNDTARNVQLHWTAPSSSLCNQFEIQYTTPGGIDTLQTILTSATTINLPLIPGDYNFYIKCACNQNYNYDWQHVTVASDTNFATAGCDAATCNYRLLIYEDYTKTIGMGGSWKMYNSKMEVTAGGQKEFYLLGSDNYLDTVNGLINNAQYYNLKFCKNDSVQLKFYELGFGYNYARIGFKLFDENNNVIQQYFSDTTFATGFPGYTLFPKFKSDCGASNPAATSQMDLNTDNLVVVPNPNSGQFQIQFAQATNEKVTLQIVDMYGKVVYEKEAMAQNLNPMPINIDHFAKGLYLARVHSASGKMQQVKFIIQ